MWTGSLNTPPRTLADTLLLAHALFPVASPKAVLAGQALRIPDKVESAVPEFPVSPDSAWI